MIGVVLLFQTRRWHFSHQIILRLIPRTVSYRTSLSVMYLSWTFLGIIQWLEQGALSSAQAQFEGCHSFVLRYRPCMRWEEAASRFIST